MFDDQNNNQAADDQFSNTTNGGPAPSMGLGGAPDPAVAKLLNDDGPDDSHVAQPSPPPVIQPQQSQPTDGVGPAPASSDLDDIKRQALDELSPLVHKLDQNPEEKYKTLMMLIQASDNQALLSEAYDAAQKISDEKVKAEALLNIVNEINYFTQKG